MTDETLLQFRKSIDNLDACMVHLLAERFRLTKQVGEYKKKNQLPPADKSRESRQIDRLRKLAESAELDPDFAENFIRFVIDEVIHHHEKIRDS